MKTWPEVKDKLLLILLDESLTSVPEPKPALFHSVFPSGPYVERADHKHCEGLEQTMGLRLTHL